MNEEFIKRLQPIIEEWKSKDHSTHYDLAKACYLLGVSDGIDTEKLRMIGVLLDSCKSGIDSLKESYKETESDEIENQIQSCAEDI